MESIGLHLLSTVQERRIMTYIEDKSLDINRAFQKRHMSSSKLRTLPDYISAMRVLIFDIVMVIPPMVPSGELRVSLLLRLTADLLEAAPEYPPFTSSSVDDDDNEDEIISSSGGSGGSVVDEVAAKYPLVELFDVLHDLDNAWAAVLSCQVWNRETRTGEDVMLSVEPMDNQDDAMESSTPSVSEYNLDGEHGIQMYAPSPTECTRLRSMVLAGMSVIEDWLDEAQVPDNAKQPFEECFDWTLRLLGDESNEVSWTEDGFVACGIDTGVSTLGTLSTPQTSDYFRVIFIHPINWHPSVPPYPKSQSAAVLVGLFVGRWGDLYVLLSRRSATLSSYAGDTALPGGRWDKTDASLEDTARREAFEEIGLPIDKRRVPLLCTLSPFLARSHVVVTPVVVLITDPTLKPILNAPEVDTLFSHPLASFLHDRAPFPLPSSSPFLPDTALNDIAPTAPSQFHEQDAKYAGPPPPQIKSTEYHSYHDMPWGPTRVRIHAFLTGRESSGTKPIAGLTASILLEVARIGYGVAPEGFEVDAIGQAGLRERIAWELNRAPRFIEALKKEGIRWDWNKEERREREKRLRRDQSRL